MNTRGIGMRRQDLCAIAVLLILIGLLVGCGSGGDGPSPGPVVGPSNGGYSGPYTITSGPDKGATGDITLSQPSNGQTTVTIYDSKGNKLEQITGFISNGNNFSAVQSGFNIQGGGTNGGSLTGNGSITTPDGSSGTFHLSPS